MRHCFYPKFKTRTQKLFFLQRPSTTLEEAEMHTKLKESVPEPKTFDRFDELFDALKKLQPASQPAPSPDVPSYAMTPNPYDSTSRPSHGNHSLNRDDIAQMI